MRDRLLPADLLATLSAVPSTGSECMNSRCCAGRSLSCFLPLEEEGDVQADTCKGRR